MRRAPAPTDVPIWQSPIMISLWGRFSLNERAEKLANLIDAGRELMLEGIRLREPGISDYDSKQRLKELLLWSYSRRYE